MIVAISRNMTSKLLYASRRFGERTARRGSEATMRALSCYCENASTSASIAEPRTSPPGSRLRSERAPRDGPNSAKSSTLTTAPRRATPSGCRASRGAPTPQFSPAGRKGPADHPSRSTVTSPTRDRAPPRSLGCPKGQHRRAAAPREECQSFDRRGSAETRFRTPPRFRRHAPV